MINDSFLIFPFLTPRFFFVTFLFVAMGFHAVFSFVLVRQAVRMIRVVEAQINPVIYFVTVAHLLLSLFTLVWIILLF